MKATADRIRQSADEVSDRPQPATNQAGAENRRPSAVDETELPTPVRFEGVLP